MSSPVSRRSLLALAAGSLVAGRARAASKTKLKIGLLLPFSGTYAALGHNIADAMKLAARERDGKLAGREIEWVQVDDESDPAKAPANVNKLVVGDKVFISETYGPGAALLKVKRGGCEVLWSDKDKRRKSMQCHWMTPIHHNGHLYGCSGRHPDNAVLRCIELATGKVMWSQPELLRTSLLMVDGHFICLSEDGLVTPLKVNPRKFEEVSRLDLRPHQPKDHGLDRRLGAHDVYARSLL